MKAPLIVQSENNFEKYGAGKNVFLNVYQQWISPVKGGNKCPMYPSCSQYAKIAFKRLPWYKAYTKSLERLLRCGNELYLYPTVRMDGNIRWYDPVLIKELDKENINSKVDSHFISDNTKIQFYDEGFADYLFQQGENYRAITEYYRLLYSCADSTKKVDLFKNIGLCYFYGADYWGYVSFLKTNEIYFPSNSMIRAEMELYLGKSYYHLNQYQQAIATLERINNLFFNETQFLLGMCYARIFDWQTVIKKMRKKIKQNSPQKIYAENISRSLKNFPKLPKRSQFLAGALSTIIPGAGYVYCERKRTGLTSLIVNGLLIWAIRDALIQKQYGLATATSFFGIGWYVGNIKGSVDAANIYNTHIRHEFIDRLLEKEKLYEYLKK